MTRDGRQPPATKGDASALAPAAWAVVAAFGTYFCMYAFRKPFTAAAYAGGDVWGVGEKTVLVTAQVLGYAVSKFLGIREIAEMPPRRRAPGILALIGLAEAALLLFAVVPSPWHVLCLFLNGLPLGMVFGLVVGYLEGRRHTEALAAGLCASFILADGATKSVGTWLLAQGVSERAMPGLAGLIFLAPLLVFVGMLTRIPSPDDRDVALRSERPTLDRRDRAALLRRHGAGLSLIVSAYLLITIARSIRADFAPEIWRGLNTRVAPATFAVSEGLVALGVLLANGLSIWIVDNRRAFFTAIGVALLGGVLMLAALAGLYLSWLGGFAFMVLMGLGLYLPYVAVHTTIFERLIAMTRDRGNLGFFMYVADSAGYLGYVALMLGKGLVPIPRDFLPFFATACAVVAILTCACLATSLWYFSRPAATPEPEPVPVPVSVPVPRGACP
jgi:hypothetical protein